MPLADLETRNPLPAQPSRIAPSLSTAKTGFPGPAPTAPGRKSDIDLQEIRNEAKRPARVPLTMAKDFRSSVQEIASKIAVQLADELVALVRNSSMAEVFGSAGAGAVRAAAPSAAARKTAAPAKRGRPSTKGDSGALVSSIAALLGKHPDGLRAEQIRATLKVAK